VARTSRRLSGGATTASGRSPGTPSPTRSAGATRRNQGSERRNRAADRRPQRNRASARGSRPDAVIRANGSGTPSRGDSASTRAPSGTSSDGAQAASRHAGTEGHTPSTSMSLRPYRSPRRRGRAPTRQTERVAHGDQVGDAGMRRCLPIFGQRDVRHRRFRFATAATRMRRADESTAVGCRPVVVVVVSSTSPTLRSTRRSRECRAPLDRPTERIRGRPLA